MVPVLMLAAGGAIQGNMPGWLAINGVHPDILLAILIATSLTLDPLAGAILGFIAGLIHGSIVGVSLGSFIISRTVIGFASGYVTNRMFSENPIVPTLAAGGLTLVAESLFLLANPSTDIVTSIHAVLAKSLLNSLITILAYWLIKWVELRKILKLVQARL